MNKIFKVVWSKVRNAYVVVSEIAKNTVSGVGKRNRVKRFSMGATLAAVALTSSFFASNYAEAAVTALENAKPEYYIAVGGAQKNVNPFSSGTIKTDSNGTRYIEVNVGGEKFRYNYTTVRVNNQNKYYWVREGFGVKAITDTLHPLAGSITIDLYKIPGTNATYEGVSMSGEHGMMESNVTTGISGNHLEQIKYVQYASVTNSGGTDVLESYQYFIHREKADEPGKYEYKDVGGNWDSSKGRYPIYDNFYKFNDDEFNELTGKYQFKGQDVEYGNVYNINGNIGVFLSKEVANAFYAESSNALPGDVEVYGGSVFGYNNEILLSGYNSITKKWSTVWAAEVTDQQATIESMTLSEFNEILHHLHEEDAKLASDAIVNTVVNSSEKTINLQNNAGNLVPGITLGITGGSGGQNRTLSVTDTNNNRIEFETGSIVVANNGAWSETGVNYLDTLTVNGRVYQINATTSGGGTSSENDGYYLPSINTEGKIVWEWRTGDPSNKIIAYDSLKGADGTNGLSAYEIWKQQTGNANKTEQEFLDSLKGADGSSVTVSTSTTGKTSTIILTDKNGSQSVVIEHGLKGEDAPNIVVGTTETVGANEQAEVTGDLSADGRTLTLNFKIPQGNNTAATDTKYSIEAVAGSGNVVKQYKLKDSDGNYVGEIIQDTDTDTKYEVTVTAGASDSTVVNTYTFKEENASTGIQIVDTDTTLDEVVKTPIEGGNKYTISDTSGNSVVLEDVASATKLQSVIGDVTANAQNISNLNTSVTANAQNISNLNTSVTANAQNISNLNTSVIANTLNISSLTNRVSANETSITNIDSRVTNNESAIEDILDGTSVYLRLGKNNKEIALSTGGHDTSSFKVTTAEGRDGVKDATLRFTNGDDDKDYFEVNVGSTVRAAADSNHVMNAITINGKTYTVSDTELEGVNTTSIKNGADDVIGHNYVIYDTSDNEVSINDVASASYVDSKIGNINQQISNLSGQVTVLANKDVYVNNTDKNLKIETKTDAGDTTYTVNLDKDVTIENSLKVGANVAVDGSGGKVSANTVAVNNEITVGAVGAVKITSTDITGLDNKTWDPNATYNSGRAATEEQLKEAISAVQQGTVAGDKYVKGGVANGNTNPGQIVLEMNNAADVVIDGLEDYAIDEQSVTVNNGTATLKVTDRYGTGTYDVTINDIASKQQLDLVAGKVETNTTNISNLTTTVNSHTDSIANINNTLTNQGVSITEISNKVDNNATAITNILNGSTVKLGVDDTSSKIVLNTKNNDTSSIVVTSAEGEGGLDAVLTFTSGENADSDFSVRVGSTVKATTTDGKLTGLTINGTPFVVQDTTLASVAVSGNDYTIYDTSGKSVVLSGIASTTYVDNKVSNINQQITNLNNTKTEVASGSSNVLVVPSTGTNGQPVYTVSVTDANTTYDIEAKNGTGSVIKEYKLKDSNGDYDDVVIKDTNTVTKLVAGNNGNVQLSKKENGNEITYTVTATDTTLDAVRSSSAVTEHKVGSVVSGRDYKIYDTDDNYVEITDVASASYVNATISNINQQIEQVAGEAAKKVVVSSVDRSIVVNTSVDKTTHELSLADNIIVDESITVGLNNAIVMNKEGKITANSLRTDLINIGDVAINASGITGLANTSWSPSGTHVSGRAATEGQLQDAVDYVKGYDIKEVIVNSTAGTVALLRNSKTNGTDNDVVPGVLNFTADGGTATKGDRYVEISTGDSEAIKLVTGSIVEVNKSASESVVDGELHRITVNGLTYTIPTWDKIGSVVQMHDYHLHHGTDAIVVNGVDTEGYKVYDDGVLKLSVLNSHGASNPEYVYIANVARKDKLDDLYGYVGNVQSITTDGIPMASDNDNTVVNHINNLYSKVQSAATEAGKKTTVSTPSNGNLVVTTTTDDDGITNYDVDLKNTIQLRNGNEINVKLDGVSGSVEAKSVKVGDVLITSEGIDAGNRKITNVATAITDRNDVNYDGSAAVNVDLLNNKLADVATEAAKETTVTVGDNLSVNVTDNASGGKNYEVALNNDITLTTKGANDTVQGQVVIKSSDSTITVGTTDSTKITMDGYNGTVTVGQVNVDAGGTVTGLTNIDWSGTAVTGRAATEDQLQKAISGLRDDISSFNNLSVSGDVHGWTLTDNTDTNNVKTYQDTTLVAGSAEATNVTDYGRTYAVKDSADNVVTLDDVASASKLQAVDEKIGNKKYEGTTFIEDGDTLTEADVKLDKAIDNVASVGFQNDLTLQSIINEQSAQLDSRINQLGSKVNKVGAGAAALAALHPMDFDPDDKLSFAVGAGNYAGETATALGAFYRPNEKVMMNVAGTYGNGENMVNMGVSFALDRTNHVSNSRTAMAKEIVDLREQVATQGQQIAQLVALVQQLAGVQQPVVPAEQLFPDVPENHWAYEYVNTLVSKGIIEGYPDGTLGGDRTMTRYEFAAMLFRAMEQGVVLSEQIRQEFEKELGRVRVDRVKGADNDPNKIERVRVNKAAGRDNYGSKIVQVKH